MTRRSIRYAFTITSGDALVGTGTMTAVCTKKENGELRAIDLPADVDPPLAGGGAAPALPISQFLGALMRLIRTVPIMAALSVSLLQAQSGTLRGMEVTDHRPQRGRLH